MRVYGGEDEGGDGAELGEEGEYPGGDGGALDGAVGDEGAHGCFFVRYLTLGFNSNS